jgi:hypothetical protein
MLILPITEDYEPNTENLRNPNKQNRRKETTHVYIFLFALLILAFIAALLWIFSWHTTT